MSKQECQRLEDVYTVLALYLKKLRPCKVYPGKMCTLCKSSKEG